jgi:hypothetical protein
MRRRIHDPGDQLSTERGLIGVSDDRDVRKLVQRLGLLEQEVALLGKAVAPPTGGSSDSGAVNRDARWHCKKCGYLLGFYDVDADVLRTRYKEHIVFVRAGVGGFVQIVCRGCSEVNTQDYVETPAAVAG